MTKHTPGPWHISHLIPDLVKDAEGNLIADCETTPHKLRPQPAKEQDIANARLIAAAPDLLDMCERLLGFAHHYAHESALAAGEGMLANAKALIAQAKGEVVPCGK